MRKAATSVRPGSAGKDRRAAPARRGIPPGVWGCLLLALAGTPAGRILAQESAPRSEAEAAAPAAAEAATREAFDRQSLALRTALHHDPTLDSPLAALVSLYRDADRLEELLGLYRAHIAQYPDDAGAKAMLVRILRELNRGEADELVQSAVQQHPDKAYLHYLLYGYRSRREDPRALESLARAVELEQRPSLRDSWGDRLLSEAGDGAGRDLARSHLDKLRAAEGHDADSLIALAGRMHRSGFHELALAALRDAAARQPDAEGNVEIDILTAKAQAGLGDRSNAGARLDALMGRLAPDYWRRSEIMGLRVSMLASDAEREKLLDHASARHAAAPGDEAAALEYAELLAVSERHREAARFLQKASEALPGSERMERQIIALLERVQDPEALAVYLRERLIASPERADLRYRLVKILYALDQPGEAASQMEAVLEQLEPAEIERRLLDLARHLRRGARYPDAAVVYRRLLEAQPARFDVVRELAETLLALEDRAGTREALSDLPAADAAIENLLDLVQFMSEQEFHSEARALLQARLDTAPGSLDLQIALALALARTGERAAAESLALEARAAADTPARYRAWLEAGLEIAGMSGDAAGFFDGEQVRLLAESEAAGSEASWTADRIERFLAFCELGEERRLEERVTRALRTQLSVASLPGEMRLRLRRLLVRALERDPAQAAELERQLVDLAREDPARGGEYDLRRALLYHGMQRADLARDAMEQVRVDAVDDVSLLKAATHVFVEFGMPSQARRCLEKITQRQPSDFSSWERRLSLLAAMGEEEELRKAFRQLLAGGDKIKMAPDSVKALRAHLLDSLWRSVSRHLSSSTTEALVAALALLDSVDREAQDPADRLWSLWARAYALNGLGRAAARDRTIAALESLAERESQPGVEPGVAFPDGLSISLPAAVELLRESPAAAPAARPPVSTGGPLGETEMAWAFEADPAARILQLAASGGERPDLLVLDDQGVVYRVSGATGKLMWRERFAAGGAGGASAHGGGPGLPSWQATTRQESLRSLQRWMAPYLARPVVAGGDWLPSAEVELDFRAVQLPRRLATDGEGRFYLPSGGQVEARDAENGRLLWRSDFPAPGLVREGWRDPAAARAETWVEADAGKVFAYLPEASVAAALDAATGRLLWMRRLARWSPAAEGEAGVFGLNSGASYARGRLFVYGRESLILDAESGATIWSFDGTGSRAFPVALRPAPGEEEAVYPSLPREDDEGAEVAPAAAEPGQAFAAASLGRPVMLDHLASPAGRAEEVKSFLRHQGSLVAPAAHWSASRLEQAAPASGIIAPGGRLLLLGDGGARVISLRLPLASVHSPAKGVFLGAAGPRAWFLDGGSLRRLDLRDGKTAVSSLAAIAGEREAPRAVLAGGRLYAIGGRGVRLFNAWDGSLIATWPWPERFAAYRETRAREGLDGAALDGGNLVQVWQGTIRHLPGTPAVCLPPRDLVAGDTLYALVGENAVAAFRQGSASSQASAGGAAARPAIAESPAARP